MKNKMFLGTILILLIASTVVAQEPRPLSLDEAVALGLQNSKTLLLDSAVIEEQFARLVAAKNKQTPDASISGSYMHMKSPDINLKIKNPEAPASSFEVNDVLYGMANISYPIYTGGKIKYGIKAAEYLIESAKLNTENDKGKMAFNIIQSYINLFKSGQLIQVLEEYVSASLKRDSTFMRLEEQGLMARNDRLKANLQTSSYQIQLLEAKSNYEVANYYLDILLGLPENTIIFTNSNFLQIPLEQQPYSYYEQAAVTHRLDLQVMDKQQEAIHFQGAIAKAEALPNIALTGGYMAGLIPGLISVTNAINAGVSVRYNLAALWKKNSELQKYVAQEKQVIIQQKLLSDNIKQELRKNYAGYNLSRQKLSLFQDAIEQATENDRITNNKYRNSLVNITDLLEANAALLSARVNMVNAGADSILAYKKLLQTTGLLIP